MKTTAWGTLLVLSVGFSHAQNAEKQPSLQERFDALRKQYEPEQDKLLNPPVQPKTEAEFKKNSEDLKMVMSTYSQRFLDLAKSEPKDKFAFTCAQQAHAIGSMAQQAKVRDFWLEHFADDPRLTPQLQYQAQFEPTGEYCRKVAERTTSRPVKAMAAFAPAAAVVRNYEGSSYNAFDKNGKSSLPAAERMKLVAAAADQLRAAVREYGGETVQDLRRRDVTIAELAKEPLYVAEHLARGRTAPAFAAVSLTDGKTHKLADYRGKVLVLDFYTYSSGYTHDRGAVLPALRRTHARFKDQPVQILSINLDEQKASPEKLLQIEKNLPWPQLWDGSKTGVAEVYRVPLHTKSTPYVLDAQGVIRGKYTWGADLDAVIADLLTDVKK